LEAKGFLSEEKPGLGTSSGVVEFKSFDHNKSSNIGAGKQQSG